MLEKCLSKKKPLVYDGRFHNSKIKFIGRVFLNTQMGYGGCKFRFFVLTSRHGLFCFFPLIFLPNIKRVSCNVDGDYGNI